MGDGFWNDAKAVLGWPPGIDRMNGAYHVIGFKPNILLKPYQVLGAYWLFQKLKQRYHFALEADGTGMGKTIQCFAAIHLQHLANMRIRLVQRHRTVFNDAWNKDRELRDQSQSERADPRLRHCFVEGEETCMWVQQMPKAKLAFQQCSCEPRMTARGNDSGLGIKPREGATVIVCPASNVFDWATNLHNYLEESSGYVFYYWSKNWSVGKARTAGLPYLHPLGHQAANRTLGAQLRDDSKRSIWDKVIILVSFQSVYKLNELDDAVHDSYAQIGHVVVDEHHLIKGQQTMVNKWMFELDPDTGVILASATPSEKEADCYPMVAACMREVYQPAKGKKSIEFLKADVDAMEDEEEQREARQLEEYKAAASGLAKVIKHETSHSKDADDDPGNLNVTQRLGEYRQRDPEGYRRLKQNAKVVHAFHQKHFIKRTSETRWFYGEPTVEVPPCSVYYVYLQMKDKDKECLEELRRATERQLLASYRERLSRYYNLTPAKRDRHAPPQIRSRNLLTEYRTGLISADFPMFARLQAKEKYEQHRENKWGTSWAKTLRKVPAYDSDSEGEVRKRGVEGLEKKILASRKAELAVNMWRKMKERGVDPKTGEKEKLFIASQWPAVIELTYRVSPSRLGC